MSLYYAQSDPRWRDVHLGGGLTLGAKGCMVCALTSAHNAYHATPIDPAEAVARIKQAGGFVDGLCVSEIAGRALGLETSHADRVTGSDGGLRAKLRTTLESGGLALLHVDRDLDLPDGDTRGKHWVLALRVEMVDEHRGPGDVRVVQEVVCSDSATGEPVRISLATLEGGADWSSGRRHYRVRAVQPVRAAR